MTGYRYGFRHPIRVAPSRFKAMGVPNHIVTDSSPSFIGNSLEEAVSCLDRANDRTRSSIKSTPRTR